MYHLTLNMCIHYLVKLESKRENVRSETNAAFSLKQRNSCVESCDDACFKSKFKSIEL